MGADCFQRGTNLAHDRFPAHLEQGCQRRRDGARAETDLRNHGQGTEALVSQLLIWGQAFSRALDESIEEVKSDGRIDWAPPQIDIDRRSMSRAVDGAVGEARIAIQLDAFCRHLSCRRQLIDDARERVRY